MIIRSKAFCEVAHIMIWVVNFVKKKKKKSSNLSTPHGELIPMCTVTVGLLNGPDRERQV